MIVPEIQPQRLAAAEASTVVRGTITAARESCVIATIMKEARAVVKCIAGKNVSGDAGDVDCKESGGVSSELSFRTELARFLCFLGTRRVNMRHRSGAKLDREDTKEAFFNLEFVAHHNEVPN